MHDYVLGGAMDWKKITLVFTGNFAEQQYLHIMQVIRRGVTTTGLHLQILHSLSSNKLMMLQKQDKWYLQ